MTIGFKMKGMRPIWASVPKNKKFLLGKLVHPDDLPKSVAKLFPSGSTLFVSGVGSEGGKMMVHLR